VPVRPLSRKLSRSFPWDPVGPAILGIAGDRSVGRRRGRAAISPSPVGSPGEDRRRPEPYAVLAVRLADGELPPPPTRRPPRPPWCGECDERTGMVGFYSDAPNPCSRCKPAARMQQHSPRPYSPHRFCALAEWCLFRRRFRSPVALWPCS